MSFAETRKATIDVPVLNVREGPGLTFNVNYQVYQDESYVIVEEKNDWLKIQLNPTETGWVAAWLIRKDTETSQQKQAQDATSVTANVAGLRIRSGPGTSFQVISYLNKGEKVQYLEGNENWTKIYYNNQEAWVSTEYILFQSENSTKKLFGEVTVSVLNVRSKPSLDASIVGTLKNGDEVTITNEREGWLEIAFNNQAAWVYRDLVSIIDSKINDDGSAYNDPSNNSSSDIDKQTQMSTATVTVTILNVRNKGSLDGEIIGRVSKGDQVKVLEEKNNWYKIQLSASETGWIAGWFLSLEQIYVPLPESTDKTPYVKILYNGTNIRTGSTTNVDVAMRANEGAEFPILAVEGDWYQIQLENGKIGYVAGWIVETKGKVPKVERPGAEKYLTNKTIVLDPGHGGRDYGTTGVNGTIEKELTLRTAKLLYDKLKASGANVVLTRKSDGYVSLSSRVSTAHYQNADAFVSLHYDSIVNDQSVKGITSYYYNSEKDEPLSSAIHSQLIKYTNLNDRNSRFGNYFVLRENKQPSALFELGYLSNSTEEMTVISRDYQEKVSTAIFYGLAQFFKDKS